VASIILEKGKPVARLGRKTKGRAIIVLGSLVTERMLAFVAASVFERFAATNGWISRASTGLISQYVAVVF
jgi:hypothetical protein